MCSLSLYTKVKDVRDLTCNLAHEYDKKYNVPFTEEDKKQKCVIFDIPTLKTDFIRGVKIYTGDHWFPIGKIWKKNKIGSDSEWNLIPVSGSNGKGNIYNQLKKDMLSNKEIDSENMKYSNKIEQWLTYVEDRGAKLSYNMPEDFRQAIESRNKETMSVQDKYFATLREITPID